MPDIRIGISGWSYPAWRGGFYPDDLPRRRELEYASRRMRSIEINGSFYSLQRPSTYRGWYDATPSDFIFAVKGSRFITHMKKLKDPVTPLANLFASGVLRLADKLGPVLWQLPPNLGYDADRVARFLEVLPRSVPDAASLARKHDERLEGRAWTVAEHDGPIRHAFEVRHPSWFTPDFVRRLREHGAALVVSDSAGEWPYAEEVTSDFVYLRLHGARTLYASRYTDEELAWWARRIRAWTAGREPSDARRISTEASAATRRDAYAYFDNDARGHAPFDAMRLAGRLGAGPASTRETPEGGPDSTRETPEAA